MIKNKDVVIAVELAFYKVNLTISLTLPFPVTVSRQCSSIGMFSVVYSIFKDIRLWNSILYFNMGGQNCKNLQTHSFLNAEGIPRQVDLLRIHLELEFTNTNYGLLFRNQINNSYLIKCFRVGKEHYTSSIFYCWSFRSNNSMGRLCLFI